MGEKGTLLLDTKSLKKFKMQVKVFVTYLKY